MVIQLINGELIQEGRCNGETATDDTQFKEVARMRVCPLEGVYGIWGPGMIWHMIEVCEPSTIFESKDGKYRE